MNKTKEVKHTPTPWRVLADGYIGADNPPYKTNKVVAEIISGNIHDKGFIVRAVNAHDALLEAMKQSMLIIRGADQLPAVLQTEEILGHAIAQAEKEIQ